MTPPLLTSMRLGRQGISTPWTGSVADTVRRIGAIQAQDYHAALWAVGLRTVGATLDGVEQAIAQRELVRTWPMRGTLHLVAAGDVRWMVALMASRVQALSAARIAREYGLDSTMLVRCRRIIEHALSEGAPVTRGDLYARLDEAGIDSGGQRGLHVLGWMAQEGLICQGPRAGKQPTFVWLDAWIPPAHLPSRDASLGQLALRYLHGHGPATAHDLAWWSGLTLKDANAALASAASQLASTTHGGVTWWDRADTEPCTAKKAVHLLPAFDEYLIGYRHRDAIIDSSHLRRVIGINGLVSASVVIAGKVAATWKRETGRDESMLSVSPLRPLKATDMTGIRAATRRYGQFLGVPVRMA